MLPAKNRCVRGFLLGALMLSLLPATASAQSDNPGRRWEYFYRQRAYPFNRIPARALQTARQQALARWPGQLRGAPAMAATTWTPVGPERININIQSTGRLVAVAIHPTNSSIMYVGGAQGGVWKSTNGGATWMPLTDKECSLAMGSIAIDPVDPNIIYAGTGEQHFSIDSYYGCGVLRSSDGGTTWTQLGGSIFGSNIGGATISRIVIDPGTAGSTIGTTVLAASSFGLFRSTNSGANWSLVLGGGFNRVTDIVIDPSDNSILYAGLGTFFSDQNSGLFKSTDGGATWTQLAGGLPSSILYRVNLAIAPSASSTVYAALVGQSDNTTLLGLYKTTDGGTTWAQQTATNASCDPQCWYDLTIAVKPDDANTVFFGGVELFKSTDGGASFFNIRGSIHVDQHFFAFDPQNSSTVFVGNDGGIYASTDGGTTWTTLNTNLALTQFYGGVSLHPSNVNVAIGGTQDNGTVEYGGSADWTLVLGFDGGFTAIDFLNPATRYAESQWTVSSGFSGPRRSDGGAYFRKVSGITESDRGLFIPPLAMDPSSPETLYFGTFRMYKTTNRGDTWSAVSSDLTNGGSGISAIAVAPSTSDVVYAGTSDANVWTSTDGGTTWTKITTGLPDRHVKDFAVDPSDPQTAFVTFSGFLSGHVFKTVNGGTSWSDISNGLPDMPVNAILLEPGTPSTIYLGTDLGVYRSTNGGGTWAAFNDGLPLVAVFDVAAESNTGVVVAATHGRSMFQLSISVALGMSVTPPTRLDSLLEGSTTPENDSALVKLIGAGASSVGWTATHGAGTWLTLTTASGTGTGRVRWTKNPSGLLGGTYVDTITVTAAVVSGSPAQIIDTLVIQPVLQMTVDPVSRSASVLEGSTTAVTDSADVAINGPGASTRTWTATHGGGAWLTVTTASGTGSGKVRWSRSPTGLGAGTYVDTITVTATGVGGSPAMIVDTLLVETALALALDPTSRADTTIEGATSAITDSATVNLTGFGSAAAAWAATHGSATWLTITTANGTAGDVVRWSRDPSGLSAGTLVDTISITAAGASGSPATVIDTLVVVGQIALNDAAQHLLLSGVLSALQEAFLDSQGNADGTFNLGDMLAWLDRCQSATPTGCLASAADVQRVNEELEPLSERERVDSSDRVRGRRR